MIDPITAFATAQAAIKGVQAAIKMGKDIHAMSGDLMKFFEAKDVVSKAASSPKKGFAKSDTAQAFEAVLHAKQLQDAENELKQHLIWSGQADVWQAIVMERNNIVQKRKSEEIAMEKAKAKKRKEVQEALSMVFYIVAAIALVALVAWGTTEYVDFMRK
jgi:ABC-type sugar transport system ATPase subunit